MRTADQTLVARMGFQDPDKKNVDHDLGCQYLTTPEVCEKLARLLFPQGFQQSGHSGTGHVEVPVMKGEGRYKQYIGFLDARLVLRAELTTWVTPNWPNSRLVTPGYRLSDHHDPVWPEPGTCKFSCGTIYDRVVHPWKVRMDAACEVKIHPQPMGDVIRQMKLYREHLERPDSQVEMSAWVLATRYPVTVHEKATLKSEGITHIRLGDGFTEYMARVRQSSEAESPEF